MRHALPLSMVFVWALAGPGAAEIGPRHRRLFARAVDELSDLRLRSVGTKVSALVGVSVRL